MTKIQVKVINKSNYPLPEYKTSGAAGMDIHANITEPVTLKPLERHKFPTGLYTEIPEGYEFQIRPRSGLACNYGITVSNATGTIDHDFRGEIMVSLTNVSNEEYTIQPGERIAQMVLAKHETVEWVEVDVLSDTERGNGAFGHTGTI